MLPGSPSRQSPTACLVPSALPIQSRSTDADVQSPLLSPRAGSHGRVGHFPFSLPNQGVVQHDKACRAFASVTLPPEAISRKVTFTSSPSSSPRLGVVPAVPASPRSPTQMPILGTASPRASSAETLQVNYVSSQQVFQGDRLPQALSPVVRHEVQDHLPRFGSDGLCGVTKRVVNRGGPENKADFIEDIVKQFTKAMACNPATRTVPDPDLVAAASRSQGASSMATIASCSDLSPGTGAAGTGAGSTYGGSITSAMGGSHTSAVGAGGKRKCLHRSRSLEFSRPSPRGSPGSSPNGSPRGSMRSLRDPIIQQSASLLSLKAAAMLAVNNASRSTLQTVSSTTGLLRTSGSGNLSPPQALHMNGVRCATPPESLRSVRTTRKNGSHADREATLQAPFDENCGNGEARPQEEGKQALFFSLPVGLAAKALAQVDSPRCPSLGSSEGLQHERCDSLHRGVRPFRGRTLGNTTNIKVSVRPPEQAGGTSSLTR